MIVKLKSGREITIDLYALTVQEIRTFFDTPKVKDKYGEDETVSRAIGLTVDELRALPYPDYRRIINAFMKCLRDPLQDEGEEKNLVSESISE